jgi:hypothetical protein
MLSKTGRYAKHDFEGTIQITAVIPFLFGGRTYLNRNLS